MPLSTSHMQNEHRAHGTVSIISDVLTQGPSATRAALITRATTSARATV